MKAKSNEWNNEEIMKENDENMNMKKMIIIMTKWKWNMKGNEIMKMNNDNKWNK